MNYAELQKEIDTGPTIEQCKRMGATHAAYGWGCNACNWWPEANRVAYIEAYKAEKVKSPI